MCLNSSTTEISFSGTIQGVSNGAWTWFSDERAIVDTAVDRGGPRILVGSVTAGDDITTGDIEVLWHDIGSGETGHFQLHEELEQDDHNGPALFVRPDGRYLAMYSKHGNDPYTRWRVSTDPHDPTRWEQEQTLDNGTGTTYCNIYRLPDDDASEGRTYCFTRTRNWDPNVLVSSNMGSTWDYGGRLLRQDEGDQRPYVRYASDEECIHFTATDDHPQQFNNSIYHGYVRDGKLFDSSGTILNENIFSDETEAPEPDDLTPVFEANTEVDGIQMTHAWTVDVAIDSAGRPVTLFQTRASGDPSDHRFFYARYDGSDWQVDQIAKAGPSLYEGEDDYTGLTTIDPDTPASVVISTPIDPRDDTELDYYELFATSGSDDGSTREWTPLTPDPESDNLRPLLPSWDNDHSALIWMRGEYTNYTQWETDVVGRVTTTTGTE